MDDTDKHILDIIQTGFPIASRPYAVIGAAVGLTESETLARVRALRGKGVIRRIGANFQSAKIGFTSTLCAASVPPKSLEAFVAMVNAHPGVTHNYLRDHPINVWFTMIGPSIAAIRDDLAAITAATGIPILNLPADRLFKIRVDFAMSGMEA
jgi:siroheme decarboxylase